jgi:hypothetical protein
VLGTAAAAVIKSDALLLPPPAATASEVSAVAAAAAAASGGVPTNKTGSSLFFDWVTAKIGLPLVSGPGGVVRGQDLRGKAAAMEAACACLAPILARVSPPATASTANPATAAAFDGPSSTQLTSLVAPRIPSLVAACQAALDDPHTPPELLPPLLRLISVVARKPKWLFHPPPPSPPPPPPSLAVGATVADHPSSSLARVSESLKSAEGAGSATAAAAADASSSHSASSGASFKDFADALLAWAVDRDTPEPIRRQTVSLLGRFGSYWALHHGFTAGILMQLCADVCGGDRAKGRGGVEVHEEERAAGRVRGGTSSSSPMPMEMGAEGDSVAGVEESAAACLRVIASGGIAVAVLGEETAATLTAQLLDAARIATASADAAGEDESRTDNGELARAQATCCFKCAAVIALACSPKFLAAAAPVMVVALAAAQLSPTAVLRPETAPAAIEAALSGIFAVCDAAGSDLDPAVVEHVLFGPGGGVCAMQSSPAVRRAAIARDAFARAAGSGFMPQRLGVARAALASMHAQVDVLAPPAGGGVGGYTVMIQSLAAASRAGRAAAASTLMLDIHVLLAAVSPSSTTNAASEVTAHSQESNGDDDEGSPPPPPPPPPPVLTTLPFADHRIAWKALGALDTRLADHPGLRAAALECEKCVITRAIVNCNADGAKEEDGSGGSGRSEGGNRSADVRRNRDEAAAAYETLLLRCLRRGSFRARAGVNSMSAVGSSGGGSQGQGAEAARLALGWMREDCFLGELVTTGKSSQAGSGGGAGGSKEGGGGSGNFLGTSLFSGVLACAATGTREVRIAAAAAVATLAGVGGLVSALSPRQLSAAASAAVARLGDECPAVRGAFGVLLPALALAAAWHGVEARGGGGSVGGGIGASGGRGDTVTGSSSIDGTPGWITDLALAPQRQAFRPQHVATLLDHLTSRPQRLPPDWIRRLMHQCVAIPPPPPPPPSSSLTSRNSVTAALLAATEGKVGGSGATTRNAADGGGEGGPSLRSGGQTPALLPATKRSAARAAAAAAAATAAAVPSNVLALESEAGGSLAAILRCSDNAAAWWAVQEAARYCVSARLRTHFGNAAETLALLERCLRAAARPKGNAQLADGQVEGAAAGAGGGGVMTSSWLLLEFMGGIERSLYNAYEVWLGRSCRV